MADTTFILTLRPLPGCEPRPDLAIVLKRLLREHKLRCVEVREDAAATLGNVNTPPAPEPDASEEPEVF